MTTVAELYGYNSFLEPIFLCGCEFEIESIKDHGAAAATTGLVVTHDHSLRNNGYEYKTLPHNKKETLELFDYLHKQLKIGDPKLQFSERTSIHVHVNCRPYEIGTLRNLVLTYALLEPLFFSFVGDGRKNNIFCVPLNFTFLPEVYKKDVAQMHKLWHKYTAFNILPLSAGNQSEQGLGTIEYRHLYGTKDRKIFEKWLTALEEFHTFFFNYPEFQLLHELQKGKTPATIASLCLSTLAKDYSTTELNKMMENTLLDVKLAQGGLLK